MDSLVLTPKLLGVIPSAEPRMVKSRRPTVLTNLELAVMHVVWRAGQPLTVREVADTLNEGREREALAYTTVQTMLKILREKGAVKSEAGEGRAHLFCAAISENEVRTTMVGDFVNRLFGGTASPLLHHLIDQGAMSREELESLRDLIDRQLTDEKEDGR